MFVLPGKVSPVQLSALFQLVSPPPPSQQTSTHTPPLSVNRNTLVAGMNALLRLETGDTVKLPVPVPVAVTTSKL